MKFKADVMTRIKRSWVVGLGIDLGSNKFYKHTAVNFFIEVTILFWTFGVEVEWKKKQPSVPHT